MHQLYHETMEVTDEVKSVDTAADDKSIPADSSATDDSTADVATNDVDMKAEEG